MPFPSVTNLGQLSGAVLDEFLHFYAQLEGYLRKEHKDDGSHGVLHADALTLTEDPKTGATGDLTMDGDLTANGETHVLGPVDITTAAAGAQVTLSDSWRIQRGAASSPLSEDWALEILDLDRNASVPVIELGYYSPSSAYVVFPRATGLALGFKDGSSVDRITYLAVQDGVYEQGRTAAMGYWESYTPVWTNLGVNNGTLTGQFARVGEMVFFSILLVWGSTTALAGTPVVTLPVTADTVSVGTSSRLCDVSLFDSSVAARYAASAVLNSATTIALFDHAAPLAPLSATSPFTWATGDEMFIKGFYKAA